MPPRKSSSSDAKQCDKRDIYHGGAQGAEISRCRLFRLGCSHVIPLGVG